MPSLPVLRVLARELLTTERAPRILEPDLVMDDPHKVAAYVQAGRPGGVMAPVYLFHCAQICEVIQPGETVIDLACGPANQLALVAQLNPDTHFIGVDLSAEMLGRARAYIAELGLKNVELRQGDIARLDGFDASSVDAVISTVALHHLPTVEHLNRTFAEVARVLRPGGGLYLVDFGHLKAEKSIEYFANQYRDRQPELFTLDYLYSLRAAFRLADFDAAHEAHLKHAGRLFSTFLAPFFVAIKTPARRQLSPELRMHLAAARANLPIYHKKDLQDLITFFRLGGLDSPALRA